MSNLVAMPKRGGELKLAEASSRHNKLIAFVANQLEDKVDFGTIQGCGKKPILFKPGAEKIATLFGFSVQVERSGSSEFPAGLKQDGGEPYFKYDYMATVRDRSGVILSSCEGSCNSWEKKYRYRTQSQTCPQCGSTEALMQSKKPGEGFFCWKKKSGCGATFPANDARITQQPVGQILNHEIFDQINTLMKMAQKRAMVGAVIIAANATQLFSRDLSVTMDEDAIDAEFVETDWSEVTLASVPVHEVAEAPGDRIRAIRTACGWKSERVSSLIQTYFGDRSFDSLNPEEIEKLADGILTEYAASRCGETATARRIIQQIRQQAPTAWGKDLADMFIVRIEEMQTAAPRQGRAKPVTHKGVSIA